MYDFAPHAFELSSDLAAPLRLRDLVAGLRSGDLTAETIVDRLDPDLADEINAVALHRGLTTEAFLVSALVSFALDAADESWRRLGERRGGEHAPAPHDFDSEAHAFTVLMTDAVQRAISRDERIASDRKAAAPSEATGKPGRRVATEA